MPRLVTPASLMFDALEDRRLMSAAVNSFHAITARPAAKVSVDAAVHAAAREAAAAVESHTQGVPQLSSRPGAPYTIYLDPAGFNFDGQWYADSGSTYTPGFTP